MVWFLSKWPQQSTRTCSEHRTCTWQVLLRGHLTFDLQRPTDLGPEEAEPLDQVCEGCELLPRADSIDQRLCSNATLWRLDLNRLRRGGKYRPVSNKAELYDPRPYLLLGEGLREKTVINWNKRPFNNSSLQFGSVPDPGLAALWAELHDRFLFTNKQLRKIKILNLISTCHCLSPPPPVSPASPFDSSLHTWLLTWCIESCFVFVGIWVQMMKPSPVFVYYTICSVARQHLSSSAPSHEEESI